MPHSFAETPQGLLLMVSGWDRVLRWNGFTTVAEKAGVAPPATACTVSGTGVGPILGTYTAYVRFVDEEGNYSDLSPISAEYLTEGVSGNISNIAFLSLETFNQSVRNFYESVLAVSSFGPPYETVISLILDFPAYPLDVSIFDDPVWVYTGSVSEATGYVVYEPHNLPDNAAVRISYTVGGDGINGDWTIKPISYNVFALRNAEGASIGGYRSRTGRWFSGVRQINYTNVPVPQEPRIARRQILRNTNGQALTYYVDVDTEDLTSSTFSSTRTDEELLTQEAVPLLDVNGFPLANRYGIPPDYKAFLAFHQGRGYLGGEVEYREGNVAVTQGGTSVTGIGTEWSEVIPGRFLYVRGARKPQEISTVNRALQTLTLLEPYTGPTNPYADYAIRPAPAERRNVYFSEAGLPEAWPAVNAFAVPEDGDDITGIMQRESFVYVLERRHIWRFSSQADPRLDGFLFLASRRGCINHRCWVVTEDSAYMLDEQGVHRFGDGRDPENLSDPIADFFDGSNEQWRINWQASNYFHAVLNRYEEVIRWYVALSGQYTPRHALCYDYRGGRWWIEEYPFPVSSSCLGLLGGLPQVYLGSEAGKMFAASTGSLDGVVAGAGSLRGTATASSLCTLTDAAASFDTSMSGVPVVITSGKGKGQLRLVISATATVLTLDRPWLDLPDTTSVYQVGGIPWRYRTGWFRYVNIREQQVPRRIEVMFDPTVQPTTMDLRIRRDRQESAIPWTTTLLSADNNGVAVKAGETDLEVDLTGSIGFMQQRLDYHGEQYTDRVRLISWELGGVTNDDVAVNQVVLDGVES